jgi:hypothetical protein
MDDLRGSASQRIEQFKIALQGDGPSRDWLTRQLQQTLEELAALEPLAILEEERHEDF